MKRHLVVAHPEVKTEEDTQLYYKLVEKMKQNLSAQVASVPTNLATQNQTLLQKLRIDLRKVCGQLTPNINEEPKDSTKKPEVEEAALVAAKLSRRHYKCHMCDKLYPSIGQHITRKHQSLNAQQKDMLRRNMLAAKTLTALPPKIKKTATDMLTANINASPQNRV